MSETKKTRNRVQPSQTKMVLDLWLSGAGKVPEIAKTMNMPVSTVYNVLYRAGVWPGHDDYKSARHVVAKKKVAKSKEVAKQKGQAKPEPKPEPTIEPTIVPPGSITLIRAPRRSLWERVRDFFA